MQSKIVVAVVAVIVFLLYILLFTLKIKRYKTMNDSCKTTQNCELYHQGIKKLLSSNQEMQQQTALEYQSISNSFQTLTADVKHALSDIHQSETLIREFQLFKTQIESLNINERLNSVNKKVQNTEKETAKIIAKGQLIYLCITGIVTLSAVLIPLLMKK